MGKWNEDGIPCRHNLKGVLCPLGNLHDPLPDDCRTCGWNPEEHARRMAKLRERLREEEK